MNGVLDSLLVLPDSIRPSHYSDNEDLSSSKDKVADKQRFDRFIEENPEGFFMLGEKCLFDVKLSSAGYSSVYLDLPEELQSSIPAFFEILAYENPIFGYAADVEERKHRNRFYLTIGVNHIEDWVGRDLDKYVSGLYCYTLLSDSLLAKHQINLSSVQVGTLSVTNLGNGTVHLLQYYEKTENWRDFAEKLDDLSEKTTGIFSIKEVEEAVRGISNLFDYDDIIVNWR